MSSKLSFRCRPYLVIFVVAAVGLIVFHSDSVHRFAFASKCADKLQDGEAVPMSLIMSGNPLALRQDDKILLDYIWSNDMIRPPSKEPYNLERSEFEDPSDSQGQCPYIRKLLKNQRNGFFVECGSADGETLSNTLFMEKKLNWSGLLVEADPSNYAKAIKKNRKAWMANNCLAVKPYPHMVTFDQNFLGGKIVTKELNRWSWSRPQPMQIQCIPLYTFLSALNVTTVDYFSLDVEGYELQVLKTIPFNKVFIRTLSVEFAHTIEGKDEIIKFMRSQGFRLNAAMYSQGTPLDLIFVHKGVAVEKMPSQYYTKERKGQEQRINITTYDE